LRQKSTEEKMKTSYSYEQVKEMMLMAYKSGERRHGLDHDEIIEAVVGEDEDDEAGIKERIEAIGGIGVIDALIAKADAIIAKSTAPRIVICERCNTQLATCTYSQSPGIRVCDSCYETLNEHFDDDYS
jgi:hypothetical protein